MRLVIVGGVAAGTKAASRARRLDPEMEITIYQEEPEPSIGECGLPYFLSNVVEERERLVARTPEKFAEKDIEVLVRHRLEKIDPHSKKLIVHDLGADKTFEDTYDRLIVATGARAVLPPVPGVDLEGVFELRFLTDADRIRNYVRERSPRRATIVGGGYIGLEVAENLCGLGMECSLIEGEDRIALAYGPEVSERVEAELEAHDVNIFTGETGAILVDKHMKTTIPEVWATGDCVETTDLTSGEPAWVPLGDTANQMGRVAGTNAATGEDTLEFPGTLGTGIFKVFDLGVGKTGLSEESAAEAGFETVSASLSSYDRAAYYPGAGKVFLKLIADRATGRLLGAEAAGSGADKLIDICATALWGGLSYPDLVNIDLAYAPPYGPALSPVIQAATILSGKFDRAREGVRATE